MHLVSTSNFELYSSPQLNLTANKQLHASPDICGNFKTVSMEYLYIITDVLDIHLI